MNESEYREALNALEEELAAVYRRRRALTEAFSDEHPPAAMPTKLRNRTEVQQRVARCPRCSARLDEKNPTCTDGGCALPLGHEGLHVPLPVLWQEAGYVEGPWSPL